MAAWEPSSIAIDLSGSTRRQSSTLGISGRAGSICFELVGKSGWLKYSTIQNARQSPFKVSDQFSKLRQTESPHKASHYVGRRSEGGPGLIFSPTTTRRIAQDGLSPASILVAIGSPPEGAISSRSLSSPAPANDKYAQIVRDDFRRSRER